MENLFIQQILIAHNMTKTEEALYEALERLSDIFVNELFDDKAVASGNLARSIKENNRVVETQEGYDAILTMLWYGEVIDQGIGRRAGGIPPIRPIEEWIKRKSIPVPSAFKSPKQFAFAIARKVAKEGTKPKANHFIEEGFKVFENTFGQELSEAVGYDINEQLMTAFEKSTKV